MIAEEGVDFNLLKLTCIFDNGPPPAHTLPRIALLVHFLFNQHLGCDGGNISCTLAPPSGRKTNCNLAESHLKGFPPIF